MPYIDSMKRISLTYKFSVPETPGDLNYLFTRLAARYVKEQGLSYQTINDILGALEGAKLEFVRRVVNPYEDSKIKENGDVYGDA